MRKIDTIPEYIKKCAVNNCESIKEFAYKYRKPSRFTQQGKNYVDTVMQTHYRDIKDTGFTCISKHDNITGKFIAYVSK